MMPRILCVEDERAIRDAIVEELEEAGYDVAIAENGSDALAEIRDVRPDLVLSDLSMPGMNGLDLLRELRNNYPQYADVPFIFLTAMTDRDHLIEAKRIGCDDYLTKPVDFELLNATVSSRLKHVSLVTDKIRSDLENGREAAPESEWMRYHDPVSGLPNHKAYMEWLDDELREFGTGEIDLHVLLIEVDIAARFSDFLAEDALDKLIKASADRLLEFAAGSLAEDASRNGNSWAARVGLNRFAVVRTTPHGQSNLAELALSVSTALGSPIDLEGDRFLVDCAIGVSIAANGRRESALTLTRHAEVALLRARLKGSGSYVLYDPQWETDQRRTRDIEVDLDHAIENDQMALNYQPRVDAHTGQIVGVEALVRWNHPQYGWIPPDQFIPAAESSGLIVRLGEWILRTACNQAAKWKAMGLPPVELAVNASSKQFELADFPAVVKAILEETGCSPAEFELELTESQFLDNTEQVIDNLACIREIGAGIAIDDFGTGFSSLSYLKRIPATTVKIDKSFISGALSDTCDSAIASAVIEIGHASGMTVVAEGVETSEQAHFLRLMSCDQLQGYLYSPPVAPEQVELLLAKGAF